MGNAVAFFRTAQDGAEALIWDGLFDAEFVGTLYKTLNNAEYDSLPGGPSYRSWMCPFEVEDFSAHPLFQRSCEALAAERPGVAPRCLSAKAQVLTFGDFVPLHLPTDAADTWTFLYFANTEWQPDWAAETILFSPQGGGAVAVPPKPGRVTAFPSHQARRLGVPSRLTHLTSVVVEFDVALQ